MRRRAAGARRRPRGVLYVTGWLLLLLGALALVVLRQTRGVALDRELHAVERERAIAEAERVEFVREIQTLRSRVRITRVARQRLGMRLPDDEEIIFLAVPREEHRAIQLASDR